MSRSYWSVLQRISFGPVFSRKRRVLKQKWSKNWRYVLNIARGESYFCGRSVSRSSVGIYEKIGISCCMYIIYGRCKVCTDAGVGDRQTTHFGEWLLLEERTNVIGWLVHQGGGNGWPSKLAYVNSQLSLIMIANINYSAVMKLVRNINRPGKVSECWQRKQRRWSWPAAVSVSFRQ